MDDDDEFGDLYTDVLRFPPSSSASATAAPPPPPRSSPSGAASKSLHDPLLSSDDDDEDPISLGTPRPNPPVPPPSAPSQTLTPACDEDGDEDWLLGHAPPTVEPPANWDDEGDEAPPEVAAPYVPEPDERKVLEEDLGGDARVSEFPEKDAGIAEEAGYGDPSVGGGARESIGVGDLDQAPLIPGLSVDPVPPGPFLDMNGGDGKPSRSEDWDTDSEDDLQIVLNDNSHVPLVGERNDRVGDEEDDDEDGEEDLVIVTDEDQHHHIPAMEEQDWGEEAIQPNGDGERKEMADVSKGNGPAGTTATRIGYSSHGFHMQHHSTYKYVRPGAAPVSGGPSGGAVGPPGQVRPPLPLGPIAGRGRGDWRPAGGRGIPNALKSFHSFGAPAWSNGSSVRAFGSGLDFTLPAHKTIFDIDIESFEEKPWRHPGVDISDFFNFGLDEDKWKDYCKQLDQLRLEATMQSKIRVYESGRSEQEYDPDLPPELAAAAGHHDISADNGYHGRADNRQTDFNSQGSGAANLRAPIPTGRAIQVETGYGERQPSIDTRVPRHRDSDAIIEIVLQDSMDEPTMNDGASKQPEKDLQGERFKGVHEFEDERHVASEQDNHYPPSVSGRKREMARRGPFALDKDGVSPFLSEAHGHYHSDSKSKSTVYSSESFGGHHDARLPQETSHGRHSIASGEPSNDVVPSQSVHSKRHDDHQKGKLIDNTEVNQTSEVPPAIAVEISRKLSTEHKYEHDEKLALADSIDVEGEEITSDFHISSETVCDDNLVYPHKKQKISSQVEQPAVNDTDDEDELRTSHSDNNRAKSGSSKDYQKRHENGEEVLQDGRSKQMGDINKRREGEEYILRRKDDYGRDARQETDRNRLASKRRDENMFHSYGHRDWEPTSAHPIRDRSFERPKESSSSIGARQRRQDDIQSRRVKDEDIKRERSEETESRRRSKARASDRNERDEDLHSRKRMDDGDWRGRNRDGPSRQRERDDILMSRHENLDDSYIRRKKDEEVSRRGKADKEDALHVHRGREDSSRRKRERDDDIDYRRREDGTRLRGKAQDHYSAKHKDDSWRHREREDRLQVKQLHENAQTHREREEGREVVRSGRAIEDKGLCRNGRNKDELKTIGSDKDYQDKDRKRYNEQSKRGDHTGEENVSRHKGHGDVHACEKQLNSDGRSSRHERLITHKEHPSSASGSQQVFRERHRENTRKGKDSEAKERKNQMVGGGKHEDYNIHQNDKVNLKGANEQESSNFYSATLSKKDHHQIQEQLKVHQLHDSLTKQGEEDLASDDENQQGSRRGRSKLERWTSHKERDYSAIENVHHTLSSVSVKEDEVTNADVMHVDELAKTEGNTNAGELEPKSADVGRTVDKVAEERHLDTMAKLKRRSERFRLPMPGEKETTLSKKVENEVRLTQNEAVADTEVKPERPARKRRWTGS